MNMCVNNIQFQLTFKKVVNDDSLLESLNDKQAPSSMLLNGLLTVFENLRSKVLTFNDSGKLEDMVSFLCNINVSVTCAVCEYCKQFKPVKIPSSGVFYPLMWQAWQMEIHILLCTMSSHLLKLRQKQYFRTCSKIYLLNFFLTTLKPSLMFLQKFLLANSHFHVVLPSPEPKKQPYYQRYY